MVVLDGIKDLSIFESSKILGATLRDDGTFLVILKGD